MDPTTEEINAAIDESFASVVQYARELTELSPVLKGACPGVVSQRIKSIEYCLSEYDAAIKAVEKEAD